MTEEEPTGIRIGELIGRTGVTRATIHHYVKEGLLPEPIKTGRNMALYDRTCVDRILLVKGLQKHYRRSLAEVKELLRQAAEHGGFGRLRSLLETQARPLQVLETPSGSLTEDEMCAQTGFSVEQLQTFEDLGLITSRRRDKKKAFRAEDVDVAMALANLGRAGFDREHGFEPADAVIYLDALRGLLEKEIQVFLEKAGPTNAPPGELFQLAQEGVERVTPLMLAIRRKLIGELLDTGPL